MNFGNFIGGLVIQVFLIGLAVGGALIAIIAWLWTHIGIVWPWFWK
jgi:hypothetical protein